MGGNVQLYLGMAQRYPHEARMLVEQLCAHLRRQQWHEAAAACHTLRGVSATLGADALAAHVGVIEERSRSGTLAGAEAAVCDTVEAMLEASLAQLAQACAVLRGEPIG